MRVSVTPKVITEGDKVVLVMGTDRLELSEYWAAALSADLGRAVRALRRALRRVQ